MEIHLEVSEIFWKSSPKLACRSMEDLLEWHDRPENGKVCFVNAKLKGAAHLWWHKIKD